MVEAGQALEDVLDLLREKDPVALPPGRAYSLAERARIAFELLQAWNRCPQLRLGQLVFAASGTKDVFDIEDFPLLAGLIQVGVAKTGGSDDQ